ncbi:MAG: hypothetical protein ACUZ8A_07155 [Candidatus Bathyanammoxibius sp.]
MTDWITWDKEWGSAGRAPFFEGLALSLGPATADKGVWWPQLPEAPILAPPVTRNYPLVGTAFDYLLRFSLMQVHELDCLGEDMEQCPPLVAWRGVRGDGRREEFVSAFLDDLSALCVGGQEGGLPPFTDDFLAGCITLAKLDQVFRSGQDGDNDSIFSCDPGDVRDLRQLLAIVNPRVYEGSHERVFLNPRFGESSVYIGGADADLVVDGTLIDIKTTKYLVFKREYLYQLIGYYLLNLREGDPYKIHSLGVYFSRHGLLFSFPIPGSACLGAAGKSYPSGWAGCPDVIWGSIELHLSLYRSCLDSDDDVSEDEMADRRFCVMGAWSPPFRLQGSVLGGEVFQCLMKQRPLYQRLGGIADELFKYVGHRFDPLDDQQVSSVLFGEFQLTPRLKKISSAALRGIWGAHPLVAGIVAYRDVAESSSGD